MTKDLFSVQAVDYARYRPSYPNSLLDTVLPFVTNRQVAWDCATGNGQAALLLADHFIRVIATDISEKQLALAKKNEKIDYIICAAEHTPIPANSVDLITVAQAYHWFNFSAFEAEVRRVGKPGSVIAIWAYNLPTTNNSFVNNILEQFYKDITGPYWDPERRYIDEGYTTVPFNYTVTLETQLSINCKWSAKDMAGYLGSWSAVQHFITDKKYHPFKLIADELNRHWKPDEIKPVSFPLFLKCGVLG